MGEVLTLAPLNTDWDIPQWAFPTTNESAVEDRGNQNGIWASVENSTAVIVHCLRRSFAKNISVMVRLGGLCIMYVAFVPRYSAESLDLQQQGNV